MQPPAVRPSPPRRRSAPVAWAVPGTAVMLALVLAGCGSSTTATSSTATGAPTSAPTTAATNGSTPGSTPGGTTAPTGGSTGTTAPATSTQLPLGDGHLSTTTPQVGWVFSCVKPQGGGGAFKDGPWIDTAAGTWDPTTKVHVQGNITWTSDLSITESGTTRSITTSDLPDHATGVFPISPSDPAYGYDRNPNTIKKQTVAWKLPMSPQKAATPTCVNMGAVGIMTSGVVLFNALDGEGRDAAAHETLDACDGHPERTGEYHYHNLSSCLPAATSGTPVVVGWAADGFPIVAGRRDGAVVTNADLDECHGTTATVPIDGTDTSTYAYWMTAEYPYSIGCYMGSEKGTLSNASAGGSATPGPPPPAR